MQESDKRKNKGTKVRQNWIEWIRRWGPTDASRIAVWLTIVVLATIVFDCVVAIMYEGLLDDSAFYLSLSRNVLRGKVPYRDLPSGYTPGASYILALLGEQGVSNPRLAKVYFFIIYICNSAIIYALLRRLRHPSSICSLLVALSAAWTLSADGTALLLEAYQNFFILLGLLVLFRWPTRTGAALAGISLGAALMVKQYSLIIVPVIAWFSWMPWSIDENGEQKRPPKSIARMLAFLGCLGVPWLLFVLLTQQDPINNFVAASTFSGGKYPAVGAEAALRSLSGGHPALVTDLIVAFFAIGLLLLRPRLSTGQLVAGYFSWMTMLCIRTYPHYVQLAIPWGVLIVAEFSRELARKVAKEKAAQHILALVLVLPMCAIVIRPFSDAIRSVRKPTAPNQIQLAADVRNTIPQQDNVLVLNGTWLYVLADLKPPGLNYRFVTGPHSQFERQLAEAEWIVLLPKKSTWMIPVDTALNWIKKHDFREHSRLPFGANEEAILLRRITVDEPSAGIQTEHH
ncbi:MAG: hypothetical protein SGJ20_01530 [Planctomycetota bacterium]|nr:hypothetical protein [Planctomycetota bacterium]